MSAAVAALLALCAGTARDARAQAATAVSSADGAHPEAPTKHKHSEDFPFGGSFRVNPSFSGGSLVTGPGRRAAGDLIMAWGASYKIKPGLTLSASELVYKSLFAAANSDPARVNDSTFGDILTTLSYAPRVTNAKGEQEPLKIVGGFSPSLGLTLAIPLSRASRYQGKLLGTTVAASLSRRGMFNGLIDFTAGFGFVKNFNRAENPSVPADAGLAVARPNGAEVLAGGTQIATGQNLTSYAFRTLLALNVNITKRVSASLTYLLFNNFRFQDYGNDDLTGKYAKAGNRGPDSQWGIASLSYAIDEEGHLSTSLSSFTVSAPFSADNTTYRFPFWDFRSTSDNYSTIGADLSYSF